MGWDEFGFKWFQFGIFEPISVIELRRVRSLGRKRDQRCEWLVKGGRGYRMRVSKVINISLTKVIFVSGMQVSRSEYEFLENP